MVPKKCGKIVRLEPEGTKLLEAYPQMAQRFKDTCWFDFFTTFQGYDEQVSMVFAQNFDGFEVVIGKLLMLAIEHSISKACKFSIGGERWWKKEHVVMEFVNQFLLPDKHNPYWKKGVPHNWIIQEWHTVLIIIHRYIEFEGRFSLVYIYHIRLLMNINGDYPLNIPYFLLKILSKMSKRVQSHPTTTKGSLFHQVLIKTQVVSALSEVQKPWNWLIQSLNPDTQPIKQKRGKGKKAATQKQNVTIDEFPDKEEISANRVTRTSKRKKKTQQIPTDTPVEENHDKATTSRGKRSKLDAEIEMFLDAQIEVFSDIDIKMEEDWDEDFNVGSIKPTVKHKQKLNSKRGATIKKHGKKSAPISKYPRRNSTRVANKYRLKSKAMFDPYIKVENVIIIEDHSEDSKAGVKEKAERLVLHRKTKESKNLGKKTERGKQIAQFHTRHVTRATIRLSRDETLSKGTSRIPKNKDDYPIDSDHISDILEAMDSVSLDDDHNSGLASRYQIKLREPKAAIDLNKPTPVEEFSEFKVKVRCDKEKIR
jgi:hypothetical protein